MKYSQIIADTYLNFEVESYSLKIKERLTKSRKVYSIDVGMFNALSDIPGRTLGRQLENLVFLELKRRNETPFYIKNKNYEIDFVLTKNQKVTQLIQVAWDISQPDTRERETVALLKASEELGCTNLLLLTSGEEELHTQITITPVWKWLLQLPLFQGSP